MEFDIKKLTDKITDKMITFGKDALDWLDIKSEKIRRSYLIIAVVVLLVAFVIAL